MNTNKIKTFAKKARIILLKGVQQRLAYWGIDKKGNVTEDVTPVTGGYMFRGDVFNDTTVYNKWQNLKLALARHTVDDIIEEAAYTWFNRLIAIKILSKNGYIDPVYEFVSEELRDPVILQKARKGELGKLRDDEKKLLNQYLVESEDEKAFGLLLTTYCRNQKLLNRVFGHIDDYTELLLPNNLLSGDGVVELINDNDAIDENDYKEVELIGWLYQFYISDKKDEVFASFKKKKKARLEDIPAVTQIFTPKWIVKYMVENTVGRIWLDKHPDSPIHNEMKYFVEPSDKENYKPEPIIDNITQLTLLDPASGSGHILVVGFDLMMKMYKEEGYSTRNAVESIIKNNLYGLDIDDRAAQLANFALIIKAASYFPDILKSDVMPNVYSFPEAANFTQGEVYRFLDEDAKQYTDELEWALKELNQGKNIGSAIILNLRNDVVDVIRKHYNTLKEKASKDELDLEEQTVYNKIQPFIEIILTLASKYHSVVTNPPYLGRRNTNLDLKTYMENNYKNTRSDLFAVFMEVLINLTKIKGRSSFINQWSWMCIDAYKKFRKEFIKKYNINSLLFLGIGVFPELNTKKVQNVSLVFEKHQSNKFGKYYKLDEDFNESIKHNTFLLRQKEYAFNQINFLSIPDAPISFWLKETLFENYRKMGVIQKHLNARAGVTTSNNDKYIRQWYEVDFSNVGLNAKNCNDALESGLKWFPYNKGGGFRRWYGNQYFVIAFDKKSYNELLNLGNHLPSRNYYFKKSITWGLISLKFSARYSQEGFVFDVGGSSAFPLDQHIYFLLAFLNSKVSSYLLATLNFTLNIQVGDLNKLLFIPPSKETAVNIGKLVEKQIEISKEEWNYFEGSWNFMYDPLVKNSLFTILDSLKKNIGYMINQIKIYYENENDINHQIISLYGLSDEINPEIALKDITIYQDVIDYSKIKKSNFQHQDLFEKFNHNHIIQNCISYAIGCFMGRYRLDKPGLHIAHPNPTEEEIKAYKIKSPLYNGKKEVKFEIDDDGIIPMLGSYGRFSDDIVFRIKHFIEVVWGEETLTENINFIQQCLDQDLEDYLVEEFWYYHCKVYQKKPIYWLFSSENGYFQVLVYMHRMNKFTVQKIRNNYLLKHLQYLRSEIAELEKRSSSLSKSDAKWLDELRSAEIECREYDKLMKDYADKQIEIDLDDGVKVNYEKFEGIVAEI